MNLYGDYVSHTHLIENRTPPSVKKNPPLLGAAYRPVISGFSILHLQTDNQLAKPCILSIILTQIILVTRTDIVFVGVLVGQNIIGPETLSLEEHMYYVT